MPHLLVLVLAGVGLYVGYKWFVHESRRVAGDIKRAEDDLKRQARDESDVKNLGQLELDPKTGEYRPHDTDRQS